MAPRRPAGFPSVIALAPFVSDAALSTVMAAAKVSVSFLMLPSPLDVSMAPPHHTSKT